LFHLDALAFDLALCIFISFSKGDAWSLVVLVGSLIGVVVGGAF
jgi:hypothetical protein